MSILRADSIRDRAGTGAPNFPNGLTSDATLVATATTATNAQGLTGTPNITVGTVTGTDATFSGNLTVQGTTTTIDTTVTAVDSLAVDGLVSTLGNVGIGTTNTTSGTDVNARQLVIRNTADPTARGGLSLIHGTSGTGGFGSIVFGSSNATRRGAIEYSHQHDSMSIETLAGEKLVIKSNGNIGLGTLSAGASDAALDIKKDNADIKLGNPNGQYHRLKSLSTGEFTINDNDTAERFRITSGGTAIFKGGLAEKINVKTQLTGANACAITDGNVILTTGNEPGNTYPNITGVHSVLASGQGFSVTIALKVNGSGTINGFHIDGVSQTIEWAGGSAPSAGSSGYDVFTFTAIKTGSGTTNYVVMGASTNYA